MRKRVLKCCFESVILYGSVSWTICERTNEEDMGRNADVLSETSDANINDSQDNITTVDWNRQVKVEHYAQL